MLDQFQYKQKRHEFQVTFNHLRYMMRMLLSQYVPRGGISTISGLMILLI